MHNLTPVQLDPFQAFVDITDSKDEPRRGRLRQLREHVRQRYATFNSATDDLTSIPAITYTDEQQADLKHCYEPNNARDLLLSRIESAQLPQLQRFCSYCGINNTGIWDHYLPQVTFPEYSIHAHNLLRCCDECNKKKLATLRDANGVRQIVNFYFDALPTEQFLRVEFDWDRSAPRANFHFDDAVALPESIGPVIQAHFKRLGLLERFGQEAHKEFAKLRLSTEFASDWEALLRYEASRWARIYSINSWLAVFYAGLADETAQCVAWLTSARRED